MNRDNPWMSGMLLTVFVGRAAGGEGDEADHMTHVSGLMFPLMAGTIFMPAIRASSAEDDLRIQTPMTQKSQASRQRQVLEGTQLVRPSPRERDAVSQLLMTNPRPKTLKDADMKYLKDLQDKAA